MSRSEKSILNDTLVAVSALPGALVYRNNTGQGWQGRLLEANVGDSIVVLPGMRILMEARPVRFGLVGSGDVMGAVNGYPVAIETKTRRGAQSVEQIAFEAAWVKAGGVYVLARSPEEAVSGVSEATLDLLDGLIAR